MKPDYSAYSRQELLESYQSIDRQLYPERFAEIQALIADENQQLANRDNITGYFQNMIVLAIATGLFLLLLGSWSSYSLWTDGLEDVLLLFSPLTVVMAPILVWLTIRRWRMHRNDFIRFDKNGVVFKTSKRELIFSWQQVSQIEFSRHRFIDALTMISKDEHLFTIKLTHYGLDKEELIDFLKNKSDKHGFELKRLYFSIWSRDIK